MDPDPHWFKIRFVTREVFGNYGFRVQDLQRVTCEKLELASHVTGLEEEMERTKLLIPCAEPAAGHVREAGAGESCDRVGGGGGED
jgi:hypothetical protein